MGWGGWCGYEQLCCPASPKLLLGSNLGLGCDNELIGPAVNVLLNLTQLSPCLFDGYFPFLFLIYDKLHDMLWSVLQLNALSTEIFHTIHYTGKC